MKKSTIVIVIIVILIILGLFSGADSSESSSDLNGKYGRGNEYDQNVYDIADAYGMDPDDVNRKIERVAGY